MNKTILSIAAAIALVTIAFASVPRISANQNQRRECVVLAGTQNGERAYVYFYSPSKGAPPLENAELGEAIANLVSQGFELKQQQNGLVFTFVR